MKVLVSDDLIIPIYSTPLPSGQDPLARHVKSDCRNWYVVSAERQLS
jgi:hypothetical protein